MMWRYSDVMCWLEVLNESTCVYVVKDSIVNNKLDQVLVSLSM